MPFSAPMSWALWPALAGHILLGREGGMYTSFQEGAAHVPVFQLGLLGPLGWPLALAALAQFPSTFAFTGDHSLSHLHFICFILQSILQPGRLTLFSSDEETAQGHSGTCVHVFVT